MPGMYPYVRSRPVTLYSPGEWQELPKADGSEDSTLLTGAEGYFFSSVAEVSVDGLEPGEACAIRYEVVDSDGELVEPLGTDTILGSHEAEACRVTGQAGVLKDPSYGLRVTVKSNFHEVTITRFVTRTMAFQDAVPA